MTDILVEDSLDLAISAGDFIAAGATRQHQRSLLLAQKGDLRQHPTSGVGVEGYLNGEETGGLLVEIRSQFELDGMRIEQLGLSSGELNVIAQYHES